MPIYTKTGDSGTTSTYGGRRVLKSDPQIEVCGQIDELSSFIGLTIAKINSSSHKKFLTQIQKDLYLIMSFFAGAKVKIDNLPQKTKKIEKEIDNLEKKLPKLNRFILPQGSELSCFFHIARTICRRVEREVVGYFEKEKPLVIEGEKLEIISYLNRLCDLFFVLARFYNTKDITVKSRIRGRRR